MFHHLPWTEIHNELNDRGFARTGAILSPEECLSLSGRFDDEALYRSHVQMERFGFGRGEYKYFADPMPKLISDLRQELYQQLRPVAEEWACLLGEQPDYPASYDDYASLNMSQGQTKPTCLLLRYRAADYNRLHQDLYGNLNFPFQLAILLNDPATDFTGGEFVLTEQKPRSQSRPHVVSLRQGEGVIFAVNERPVMGTRGAYRVKMRHGVSEVLSGERHCLGIICHLAQ